MLSNFTKKYLKKFKNDKYSLSKSSYFMRYIYNEYINIINFINSTNFNVDINIVNNITPIFNKYSQDAYFIMNKEVTAFNNHNLDTLLISYDDNNIYIKYDQETIKNKIVDRLLLLIKIIEYMKFKVKATKKFEIYLSLSNLTKYFPNNEIVNVKHINSGFTDHNKKIIYVWRYEEFEKVLIHEVIHYISFFQHDYDNIYINHGISGKDLNFEAITDFWAIIYHSIYVSIYLNKSVRKILEFELGFIRNQAMIMNNYFDKYKRQKTNAYSYYILKYRLFDYIIKHDIIIDNNIINNDLLRNAVNQDFILYDYIDINSSRMTLFQLD